MQAKNMTKLFTMTKLFYLLVLLFTASTIFTSYGNVNNNPTTDTGVVINGITWATRNLDYPGTFAPYPHSAGRFFQWGTLNGETHHWASTGTVTGWNNSDSRVAWTSANNPCPPGWRVPTRANLESLSSSTWVTNWNNTGVDGHLFGTAPNLLFFPAAGNRNPAGTLLNAGSRGFYWSNTRGTRTTRAWGLRIGSTGTDVYSLNHAAGFSVRCVAE